MVGREGLAHGSGLYDQKADMVGDDVVQLPGDPHPLGGDGAQGRPLLLVLGLLGPLPVADHKGPVRADVEAHRGHGGNQGDVGDQRAKGAFGETVERR